MSNNAAWKRYVAGLCSDAFGLSSLRIKSVIEEIEALIATDQLSELSVGGVLFRVGMRGPTAEEAARSIRTTIRDTSQLLRHASKPLQHADDPQPMHGSL